MEVIMAREIPITKGYVAVVDDDDYDWLSKHRWCASVDKRDQYVSVRTTMYKYFEGYKWRRGIKMHRMILDAKPGEVVDHINGDPLDNRRENLRLCTLKENSRNATKQKMFAGAPCTSKYKGVSLCTSKPFKGKYGEYQYWRAGIGHNGVFHYIGQFKTEKEAALAYDEEAIKRFGEFAKLNFPATPPTGS